MVGEGRSTRVLTLKLLVDDGGEDNWNTDTERSGLSNSPLPPVTTSDEGQAF